MPADFNAEMHEAMMAMWGEMHSAPPSGNPDLDFLAMMIPHHAGAIAMARLVLLHGSDPIVRTMAEAMIGGQASEIEGMRGRQAALLARSQGEAEYPQPTGNAGPPNPDRDR